MKSKVLVSGMLLSLLALPAMSQQAPAPNSKNATPTAASAPTVAPGTWRASKLIGVDVYNEQNENLGEINEVLLDRSGRVAGVVLGVGGFLGMGERNVMVTLDKLRFMNEPRAASGSTAANNRAATTGGSNTAGNTATTAARNVRNANERWYPDHAVMAGATKDSLKGMAEFKYD